MERIKKYKLQYLTMMRKKNFFKNYQNNLQWKFFRSFEYPSIPGKGTRIESRCFNKKRVSNNQNRNKNLNNANEKIKLKYLKLSSPMDSKKNA